ncbi:MAG: hypothetical protein M3Z66_24875, partial [Chloroflexota bacterium]|nr:hypothetical protein [Chloroflexota bacterium]
TLLSGPTVNITSQTIRDIIVTPLQTLESDIALHPDVSRCLNERLDAWKSSALPQIYADALKVGSDLPAERAGFDLLHTRMLLGTNCQATDGAGAPASLLDGLLNTVEGDFAGRSWQRAALEAREALLQGADVKGVVSAGIQAAARGTPERGTLLDIARVSYAYGDDADSATIASRVMPPLIPSNHPKHHKKRHHGKSHPASPPAPRPSLATTLSAGLGTTTVTVGSGSMPSISWQAVSGASDYAVTVLGPDGSLLWSWSGKGTSTVYGDTTIDGVPDTEITWPLPLPASGYTVSLMALDSSSKIIAAKLRG